MKVLITGSGGMVGSSMKKVLKDYELLCPKKHELNVANYDQVMKYSADQGIKWIIHLACETDHEYCDANPTNCYYVNTIGTANMVELAKALQCQFIYISTASIFDGKKEKPYEEYDEADPINHYNKSKYYGELIARAYESHWIIRAGWMFGGGEGVDKKFVSKIIAKVLRGDKEIFVADDCIGSPTYSLDLATAIRGIMENCEYGCGIYHCVNECGEGVSRYEFAKEIVKIMGYDVGIVPCKIDDLKTEFPCKRTNYEVLKPTIKMHSWNQALKGYLYANYRH